MILEKIVAHRKEQLEREKKTRPLAVIQEELEARPRECKRFSDALRGDRLAVIAEVKKASPSKGLICADFHPVEIARQYEAAGADAVSVLTEEFYFQGNSAFLREIRQAVSLPLLRKDFIIDPYQIYEAKALGADAVLLIAALLDGERIRAFRALAESLGMQCLTEAHDEAELERALDAECPIIGINNRNLKTFEVDLNTTARLSRQIPAGKLVVSESGIATNADMRTARQNGADAVLIGETLMRSGTAAETLLRLREGVL